VTDIPRSTRVRDDDVAAWPLLERDAEVGALADAVAAARDGRGGVVLVRAAAGLGKTRLLGAAAQLARAQDMTVLQAGGSVLERDFPFGVVLRLLERWIRDAPEQERARAFEGSAALAEPMLLGYQAVEQVLAGGSEASLVHALQWLVVNLSGERPLALVVDDLHWADAQSIRLLIQLAARIEELGVLVVAAVRPREPDAQTALLAQLTAGTNVRLVEPPALSDAASAVLVRGEAPRADAFVRSCFEETGGNPFLLRELLRALAADGVEGTADDVPRVRAIGPEAVAHSVAATLARLGAECAALATAVAVLAGDAELHVAALLAGLDRPTASRAAAALQDAGLLDDDPALRFRHPLLRRAVYERPAPAARAALHRTAARFLFDRAAPHDVASHLVLTPGAGERWAVDVLRAAAREASALAGHAAAARLLRRALLEPPEAADRPAVLEEAALAAVRAGAEDAVPALEAAIEAAAAGRDRARLWLVLARTSFQRGEMRESVEAAERGLAALDDTDAEESLTLELEAARNAASLWTPAGGEAVAARFAASAQGDAPPRTQGEREVLAWLAGLELLRGEDRERTLTFARRAWDDGAYLRQGGGDAAAMGAMTSSLVRSGAWEESFAVLDALIDDARRRASPFAYATWRATRGTCLLHVGRLAEAESDLEDALAARALGWDATAPIAIESLVTVLVEQDRLDDADAILQTAATLERKFATGPMWASVLAARGRHALASGDPQAARDHFLAAGRFTREVLRTDNPGVIPWRSGAALAERELGAIEAARALAAEEVAAARRFGAPRPLAVALRAQAVVVGGADGLALASEAAHAAQDGGAVLEHARALGTMGALLRANRRRADAQDQLRRALDIAAERSAHMLVRTLREELVASGGRPRRARTHGPGSLTAGERRVALLAADGLTNRQIADALFVTPKAIGFHLGNVYRKLGIRGREHLPAALERTR
jgi:DNA-binding CsgD family transcriptional regulator